MRPTTVTNGTQRETHILGSLIATIYLFTNNQQLSEKGLVVVTNYL